MLLSLIKGMIIFGILFSLFLFCALTYLRGFARVKEVAKLNFRGIPKTEIF